MVKRAKYEAFTPVKLKDRKWPDEQIREAPLWCSVDLRDGNQALPTPMNIGEKDRMFALLLSIGFREIEVGFPSASQIEYDFLRSLIDNSHIPDDVWVQVLTQSRKHLIERTVESLVGCNKAIIHLYNSTSEQQRRITFRKSREEIKEIAVAGTQQVIDLLPRLDGTEVRFEYTPESFTGTELDFAVEVCDAVIDLWEPEKRGPMIINLPATVELSTPNIYADQIEWVCRHLRRRSEVLISLHTHNDRGTGAAATELGLLAGGERVEGTLFGNGERTGNVDIITLALNLFSQGVEPGLNVHDIPRIRAVYEETTRMSVHERHPYGGDLVFTAFSGSHQDAISKGMALQSGRPGASDAAGKKRGALSGAPSAPAAPGVASGEKWDVPYLPIDPQDIGRTYKAIIRINSQSGKGGVSYVLETDYGLRVPRSMQPELGAFITVISDRLVRELSSGEIFDAFSTEYVNRHDNLVLTAYNLSHPHNSNEVFFRGMLDAQGQERELTGRGNGPMDAFMSGLNEFFGTELSIAEYEEQAIGIGSATEAAAYIRVVDGSGSGSWGVGRDTDSSAAHFTAILCAINRRQELIPAPISPDASPHPPDSADPAASNDPASLPERDG
ncbi:MAG: 2-isopropylmalate synthase [Salinispira sp.]